MKIEIKLITSRKETAEGFPLVVEISHQNKRKSKTLASCLQKHFIQDGKTISAKHPDYDVLAPILEKPVKLTTTFQCKLTTNSGAN